MTPPIEKWIEESHKKFNNSLSLSEGQKVKIGANEYQIIVPSDYSMFCIKNACKHLKDEIAYRQIQLIEKYCS